MGRSISIPSALPTYPTSLAGMSGSSQFKLAEAWVSRHIGHLRVTINQQRVRIELKRARIVGLRQERRALMQCVGTLQREASELWSDEMRMQVRHACAKASGLLRQHENELESLESKLIEYEHDLSVLTSLSPSDYV